jgi:hypothetical protein
MTTRYSNIVIATDNFSTWIERTNQILYALDTIVVTTNSNTAVGNSAITGTFTSNNIFTNEISGGSFGNTQPLVISTNTSISGTLSTNGAVVLSSTLTVGGILTVNANTSVNGDLSSTGNTSIGGALTVGNTLSVNTATVSNTSHDFFLSGTGNTVFKNDASGFRTSLDVYSKNEANTIINNKTAEVDASAIAYAIALG